MKTSLTLLGASSIGLAVYVGTWELDHESVRIIHNDTRQATSEILTVNGGVSDISIAPRPPQINTTQPTTVSRTNPVSTQVDPHVQRIISGMSWYQSCNIGQDESFRVWLIYP